MSLGSRLCACLLNISEAKNKEVVTKIAKAALQGKTLKETAVLNIFSDQVYNRSVITITSSVEEIGESVVSACKEAYNAIDVSHHIGGHPRLGAVDLIPIHPLSKQVSLEKCGQVAIDIANRLAVDVPGTSFFLFGSADLPQHRGLVQKRKDVRWYSGKVNPNYVDVGNGEFNPKYGLTGIGAIPYVMNCNVRIDTLQLELGHSIAKSLRATTEKGLPGVQTMAFLHDGCVEIACNVKGLYIPSTESFASFCSKHEHLKSSDFMCSFEKYCHISPALIERKVAEMALSEDVTTKDTVIVGFKPEEAEKLALQAVSSGQREFWKNIKEVLM